MSSTSPTRVRRRDTVVARLLRRDGAGTVPTGRVPARSCCGPGALRTECGPRARLSRGPAEKLITADVYGAISRALFCQTTRDMVLSAFACMAAY